MRYGTWKIDFSQDPDHSEGTTPLALRGEFQTSPADVAGYIPGTIDISLLSQWSVVEITATAFLTLAQGVNSKVTMDANGLLVVPAPVI